jgi:fructan beta-fructosidase
MNTLRLKAGSVLLAVPLLVGLAHARGASGTSAENAASYREPYRPQFHFTPARNWMNDPNGLVFFDGEFHLFYQTNPFGDRWGHMSWGHAVSPDLVHWQHLPLALAEEKGVMAFSGSAVVDWKNSSGFGREGRPPLVAVYTGHYTEKPLQNQHLAYSNDRGRTWTKHAGNPVLDIGQKDFRDPKVLWHAPSGRWVMVVAWPEERKVRFYASPDLKTWSHLADFGPAGATGGIWECPDLFPLPVEGAPGESRWVLIVNLNPGGPAGGSGSQYFVGDFDGSRFTLDESEGGGAPLSTAPLWLDHGPDFYAAVTWSDVPAQDGRRIALGWMSNWDYAQDVPTSPWRSAMSVPRALTLRRTPEGLRLRQEPVRELDGLRRGAPRQFSGGTVAEAAAWLARQASLPSLLDVELTLSGVTAATPFALELSTGPDERTTIAYDPAGRRLAVDRARSGHVGFQATFAGRHEAPLRLADGLCRLRLLLDESSLEVFAQDGEAVITSLLFPTTGRRVLSLSAGGAGTPTVVGITLHELGSAWRAEATAAR